MHDPGLYDLSPLLRDRDLEHGFGVRGSDASPPPDLTQVVQVHGARLLRAPAPADSEADALWTDVPGHAVAVRTADCVPLLIAPVQGTFVAAVHAGWRGTAARIAERSAAELCRMHGARPADLRVAIGPHIGPCCYEVDDAVRDAIGHGPAFTPERAGHYMLDLESCTRAQLARVGVPAASVARVGGCTSCEPRRYASYRRDGAGERMLHWIRMPGG